MHLLTGKMAEHYILLRPSPRARPLTSFRTLTSGEQDLQAHETLEAGLCTCIDRELEIVIQIAPSYMFMNSV